MDVDVKAGMEARDMLFLDPALYESSRTKTLGFRFAKRTIDIAASFMGLVILSPVFLVTAAAIKLEDGSDVFYVQERIGKWHKPFRIYKFRSMKKDADKIHEQLRAQYGDTEVSFKPKDDPRVTKTGKIIRKFNIDELPQLLNILKGDMSIVGPRPLPVYEYEEEKKRYGNRYEERYSVPQGLTCFWQIADRSEVDFADRMQMDVDYARKCTLWTDIGLIIKTLLYTITGRAEY